MKNIYIHIPFCVQNCSYCTFTKVISCDRKRHSLYFQFLKDEILHSNVLEGEKITTLYFGGGTPSLIDADILADFMEFLKQRFCLNKKEEVTLECHPNTVTEKKIIEWEKMGITRLSLGVQTFQKKFDSFLERDLSKTLDALHLLQNRSFDLSCDLIFGFPDQTQEDIEDDLSMLKNFHIDHVSYYALDYKIHSKIESQESERLDFETLSHFYHSICESMKSFGFEQYEIFNFMKNGKVSEHNLNFWKGEDYRGFGLSAVSGIGDEVIENTANLNDYLQKKYISSQYVLSEEEILENFLRKRLHLNVGVNLEELQHVISAPVKRGQAPAGIQPDLVRSTSILENAKTIQSWIQFSPTHFFLTEEGKMNFEEVIEVLMEAL